MPFDDTTITTENRDLMRLRAVRNRICTPRQWNQGHFYSHGRFCILGAIDSLAANSVEGILHKHLPLPSGYKRGGPRVDIMRADIMTFNDAQTTKHKHVMALFDAAIADLENQGV